MKLNLRKHKAIAGASCLAVVLSIGAGQFWSQEAVAQDATVEAPRFEVDPFWPKPLPNNWMLGRSIGVAVDKNDNIWMIHRGTDASGFELQDLAIPPEGRNEGQVVGKCCYPSPPVMQFDQEGNLLQAWGGPSDTGEYEWPASNHGIAVDEDLNIYIGGNGGADSHVLKFTSEGEFVAQFGRQHARLVNEADGTAVTPDPLAGYAGVAPGGALVEGVAYAANSMDMESFGRVAKIDLDEAENEAYLSDGYRNHRVAVVDMDTGEVKRFWGAYGKPPTDIDLGPYDPSAEVAQQFRNPVHCANVSNDGLVYVCDRPNNRVQIFEEDGTFVEEVFVATETLYDGSVWDIDFSADPEQKYLYMADGQNEHLRVFDRATMQELYTFGSGGRQPGMWMGLHSIAVDSSGNLYTTETYSGKRLQKFVNMGIGPVESSLVNWPM